MCALLVSVFTLSGAANVITFTTAKAVGEEVTLTMTYTGAAPKLTGLTGTPVSKKSITYKLTSQKVTITGDVTKFSCANNQLTALDLSKNTALTMLWCYKNQLTALNLSKNTKLTDLDCSNNQLPALDLSKNTKLTRLRVFNNQLTALDLSKNPELAEFYGFNNKLTGLNLSKNTKLLTLSCYSNQLTTLDVTKNSALSVFFCNNNQLIALDVSKNTKLRVLYCGSNKLIALGLSKNIALIELNCYDNQLTALDVSTNTKLALLYCDRNKLTELDVSKNSALENLFCSNNQLTTLDVSKNTLLTHLQCFENRLTALDLSKNTALASLHCYGNQIKGGEMTRLVNSLPTRTKGIGKLIAVQYPAPEGNICLKSDAAIAAKKNWNTYLYDTQTNEDKLYGGTSVISFTTAKAVGETVDFQMEYTGPLSISGLSGTPQSGKMVTYEITSQNVTIAGDVTKLWCANNKLTALDLTRNSDLTVLSCGLNQLTTLDLSKNAELTELNCNHNQLMALDLSPNLNLTALWCKGNKLTELDLSNNTKLTKLWCGINQLTTLDVSHNTALTGLGCYANELTAMDLSHNTDLVGLWCYGNQIKGKEMTRMVNSLPDRTGKEAGEFIVVQDPEPEGNVCLKSDVAIAEGKHWNAKIIDSRSDETSSYEGEEPTPFTVTFTKVGEGTLLISGASDFNAVPYGTELTIEAFPAAGYELTALTANGEDISATGKFTVTAATEVKATFTKKTYAVTFTKVGEGALLISGASDFNAVTYGTELTIEAIPAEGYELAALTANGTDILATKKFTVTANIEVKATFTKKTFAVTLTKEGEGTLTATGAEDLNAVPLGTELTIEATPADGYELKALTANGTDILATKKFTVTANIEVKATFTKKTFAVTLTKEGEGTLTATGAEDLNAVPLGTELTIEATPAAGYELTALTANGTDILATKKFVVTAATEVKAIFTKKTAADVVESSSVRLYPNPASAYVNVKGAKADALVRLYDANGTLRYEARTDADGTLQIDLSAYAEGTYLLRVGDDAQRLLIQR